MILRKVTKIEPCEYGRYDMDLECGHRLEEVRVRRSLPGKKRCHACELVDAFAATRTGDYKTLVRLLYWVPADDQPKAMLEWIYHYLRAEDFYVRIPGLDFLIALRLTEQGGMYPLPVDGGDWDECPWK